MFSPLKAVQGHDRTYVRRMSTAEYVEELRAEEADITGRPFTPSAEAAVVKLQSANVNQASNAPPGILKKTKTIATAPALSASAPAKSATNHEWEFVRRRDALTSLNPHVSFSSRYPTYDRLGHELSVMYQFQDMTVQQERQRVATRDARTRRSGVRLSAELELDRTASRVLTVHTRSTFHISRHGDDAGDVEDRTARDSSTSKSLVRPSHIHHVLPALCAEDETPMDVDVTVSELTRVDGDGTDGSVSRGSCATSRRVSRLTSARPSEFTIYRDSEFRPSSRRGGAQMPLKAASAPPPPRDEAVSSAAAVEVATGRRTASCEGGALDHRTSHAPAVLLRGHSASPTPVVARDVSGVSSAPRARSLSGPPLAPLLAGPCAPHPYLVGAGAPHTAVVDASREGESDVTAHTDGASAPLVPPHPVMSARVSSLGRGRLPFASVAGRKRFASVSEPPPQPRVNDKDADDEERATAHGASVPPVHGLDAPAAAGASALARPPTVPTTAVCERGLRMSPVPVTAAVGVVAHARRREEVPAIASPLSRVSTAVRATKQLFRGTLLGSDIAGSRGTTSATHRQLIPSAAYGGPASTCISAAAVATLVEENLEGCAALSDAFFLCADAHAPELQCGHVIALSGGGGVGSADSSAVGAGGRRWFRLVRFIVTADVYEAVEVEPVPHEGFPDVTGEEHGDGSPAGAVTDSTKEEPVPAEMGEAVDPTAEGVLRAFEVQRPTSTTDGCRTCYRLKRGCGADTAVVGEEDTDDGPHFLLYRWRGSLLPAHLDESRRAALGLRLVAPEVQVSGYRYADGSGLTVLALPWRHHAVPIASLPHAHADSFLYCVKLLAKMLSCTVPRRTVHGNLDSLAEVFLVAPVVQSREDSPDGEGEVSAAVTAPLVVPVHWERFVDFNMFADRAAGRHIPYDPEDNRGADPPSLLWQGSDIHSVLQTVLEHKFASSLPSESYAALQKLLVMSTQAAPMANLLVETSNLIASLPNVPSALSRTHATAVSFYKRIYAE